MKIAVLVPFHSSDIERIAERFPDADICVAPDAAAEEQIGLLSDAEIVIGEPEYEAIEASDSLRFVQMTWAGTDKYTRSGRAFPDGITLASASGAFGQGMAQYALGVILSLYRRIPDYLKLKAEHRWLELPAERSVAGKSVLIFGSGNVGGSVAKLLRAAGARYIIGVRRNTAETPPEFDAVCSLEDAEGYIPDADIVIGCMPNTDENQGYFTERRLRSMKHDAVLVNMGRGAFVDCTALSRVLNDGHLYGAALDVTEPEPLPPDHPLWDCERLILTPHMAGPSFGCPETEQAILEICIDNIGRYKSGKPIRNKVLPAER